MSIKLSDNIRVGQQKPLEDKYFNELVPYTSTTQVNTLLPKAVRHIGLTVNINGEEYWYKDGIEDANLVLKVPNIDTLILKNQEQDDRLENLEGENAVQNDLINDLVSDLESERTRNDIQDSMLYNLEGINYVWSPTNRTLTLYDREGTQLSQVSLVSLDNEGTDLRYNASTLSLELYNADNELLDSIPVSSFIGSVGTQLQLNSNQLQLRDSQGNILSTVSFTVNNIQGLQTALDGKLDKGGYTGTAQDLKNDIENLQIGGSNLIINSTNDDTILLYGATATRENIVDTTLPSKNYFKFTNVVRTVVNYVFYIPTATVGKFSQSLIGKKIQISFHIRSNNSQKLVFDRYGSQNFMIDSTWKKVRFNVVINGGNLHFLLEGSGLTSFDISSAKIEFGDKATDWTPAPEDKQDRLQSTTAYIGVGKTDASATEKLDVNGNVKATGFKTPTGTATQALTANGDTFDLTTKADLVGGKIPASQLPAYVDDVLEFANLASFPATGETGKIYVDLATNRCYRWSGSAYVYITSGAVDSVNGKTGVVVLTKADVGLGNVPNLDTSNPANIVWAASYRTVTDTEKTTWNGKQNALGYTAENSANKKTAWQATPDNTSYPSEKLVKDSLDLKVDKVTGKQLSTEDYTTAEKTKLSGIAAGANNYVHPTGDGNSHIPATGTTNNGKVLKAGATANSASWGNVDWSEIANKPITFTLTAHNHAISEVTNLQTSLDSKVNTSDVVTTATANKILKLDANEKLPANITGNADGNAATATKLQTARTINGVSFDGSANITINAVDSTSRIASTEKGAVNGVATLDSTGKVPSSQLPSYVNDVLEFANLASFPATGESGKIYIALDTNLTYRWGGSSYVVMSSSLALGETSSTAYRGDRGKTAYDHSQATGNPHNTTKSDIGLGNVENTKDADKPISTLTQQALNNKQDKLTNPITGTGTTNYLTKFTSSGIIGNSLIYDNGTSVGIGTPSPSPTYKLDVTGAIRSTQEITALDFIGTSDFNLKENIETYDEKPLNTKYRSFNFKNDDTPRIGLIAQELEQHHPEFVRTDMNGEKSISYIDLHSAEIAYLKKYCARLEEELNELKNKI